MTLLTFIRTIIELALVTLLLVGYLHEDQVVDFERGLWQSFCDVVNYYIRQYERGKHDA